MMDITECPGQNFNAIIVHEELVDFCRCLAQSAYIREVILENKKNSYQFKTFSISQENDGWSVASSCKDS